MSARVLWTWIDGGNAVAEFWTSHRSRRAAWHSDRLLGTLQPRWSVTRALKSSSIPLRRVGPLRTDATLSSVVGGLAPDVLIVASFPYIVPEEFIRRFPAGAVNFHPSCLPHYQGLRPLFWMIRNDDCDMYGGVTLHQLVAGVDKGDVIGVRRAAPPTGGTYRHWQMTINQAAASLAGNELTEYLAGRRTAIGQTGRGSYYPPPKTADMELSPRLSGREMLRRAEWLGTSFPIFVRTEQGSIPIGGAEGIVGPVMHEPARITTRRVETDASDARVALRRRTRWRGLLEKMGYFANLARTNPISGELRDAA
jgi:methionyl-tRNA formyltransferase